MLHLLVMEATADSGNTATWPVIITGLFSVAGLVVSNLFGRKRSDGARLRSSESVIRVYDDYAEACRHALREAGKVPPPWPDELKDEK